jgi:hypothetical protein
MADDGRVVLELRESFDNIGPREIGRSFDLQIARLHGKYDVAGDLVHRI